MRYESVVITYETKIESETKINMRQKLKVWSLRIPEGNSDILFHFSKMNNKEMVSSIIKHLKLLNYAR